MPSVVEVIDNYKVLDVSRTATTQEIRVAYKKLVPKSFAPNRWITLTR
jgi:DnaJ-class molecular chaperone